MMHLPGVCRYCGCTESNACRMPDGDTCSWYDQQRTVCSAPGCIRAYEGERKKARAVARPRRRSTAEIYELQREERKARAKRCRDLARAAGLIRPKGGAA